MSHPDRQHTWALVCLDGEPIGASCDECDQTRGFEPPPDGGRINYGTRVWLESAMIDQPMVVRAIAIDMRANEPTTAHLELVDESALLSTMSMPITNN